MTDELKARIDKTMQNLKRNKMEPYFCNTKEEACELVKTLINKGDVISSGGSVTLKETGVYENAGLAVGKCFLLDISARYYFNDRKTHRFSKIVVP